MAKVQRNRKRGDATRWIGRVIDQRYRIVKPLGEGAMGTVFVAEHLTLPKQVALKVVRSELAGNRELSARFAREAMAGSKIDHPSIVAALDYGPLDEGGAYLVMPLVPGKRLTDILDAGPMPWVDAAELAAQIADALAAAWAQGFVHRDLKPDNVLVEEREQEPPLARVLDFGVAKLTERFTDVQNESDGRGEQLTKEGTIIGTPGYMAPEQALGRSATHGSDLYSLGVILWEAIAGEPMWTGDSARAIMRAQLQQARPGLREMCADPTLPAALEQLVTRLVSVRPEQRPSSAAEVRDLLRELVQQRKDAALAPPLPSPVPAVMAPPNTPRAMSPAAAAVLGVLGAVVLLLVVIAVGPFEVSVQKRESIPSRAEASEPAPASATSAVNDLIGAAGPEARRAAAKELLQAAHSGSVPPYAVHLARLEVASTCAEKKRALEPIRRLGDARVRPALARLSAEPKTGCGPRKERDCLSCLREDLRELLNALP